MNWANGVDLATGRPNVVPEARTNVTNKAFNLAPGPAGAHAWQSMSYSPITKLVYIPATTHWQMTGPPAARQKYLADNPGTPTSFTGRLMAWDPVAQKEVWRSEEFINPTGGVQVTAGALATAGNVVFHGNLPKQEFSAYRATDGRKLWSFNTRTPVLDNPISYEISGEQYVAIAVGGPMPGGYYAPNGARLLVFKLGGKTMLPDLPEVHGGAHHLDTAVRGRCDDRQGPAGFRGAVPAVPWPQWRCKVHFPRPASVGGTAQPGIPGQHRAEGSPV